MNRIIKIQAAYKNKKAIWGIPITYKERLHLSNKYRDEKNIYIKTDRNGNVLTLFNKKIVLIKDKGIVVSL